MTLVFADLKSIVIGVSCIERVGAHTWNRRCSTLLVYLVPTAIAS